MALLFPDRGVSSSDGFQYDPMFDALDSAMEQAVSVRVPSPTVSSLPSAASTRQESVDLIQAIHSYSSGSPEKLKREVDESKKKLHNYSRRLYKTKKTIMKLQKKVTSLQEIIIDLKYKEMLTPEGLYHLQCRLDNAPENLLA